MDFHSLVATNLPRKGRPRRMDAAAEERYYRDHDTSPRLWLGWIGLLSVEAPTK